MSGETFYRAVTPYEEALEQRLKRAIEIAAHRDEKLHALTLEFERVRPVLEAARLTARCYGINPDCACAPCSVARTIRAYDSEPPSVESRVTPEGET